MTKKISFIADFFADQVNGGGELNNEEAILLLSKRGHHVERVHSQRVTPEYIQQNKDNRFLIANFIGLSEECKRSFAEDGCKYAIYEHDHKYLKTRDPSYFKDYSAPEDQIINYNFYKGALGVFCQSKLHKHVVEKNLKIDNVLSLGGNLWSEEILSKIDIMSRKNKRSRYSIWESLNPIKATSETIAFCYNKKIPYDLVGNLPYEKFLDKLSENDTFIFLPKTLETLCRVVVEARMCGMKVVTNKKVGATSEEWFALKGKDLINEMKNKRETIIQTIEEIIL
jgi:hypothetical protein